jgi:hypothetical protein
MALMRQIYSLLNEILEENLTWKITRFAKASALLTWRRICSHPTMEASDLLLRQMKSISWASSTFYNFIMLGSKWRISSKALHMIGKNELHYPKTLDLRKFLFP